jgi:competence protein ComEC
LDFDHIGGIDDVVGAIPVDTYMDNGDRDDTQSYRDLVRALHAAQVSHVEATSKTILLGSATLTILPPPNWGRSTNNESIGILVEYGEFRALLTGDSESESLAGYHAAATYGVAVFFASTGSSFATKHTNELYAAS